jgi:hypothetical protein
LPFFSIFTKLALFSIFLQGTFSIHNGIIEGIFLWLSTQLSFKISGILKILKGYGSPRLIHGIKIQTHQVHCTGIKYLTSHIKVQSIIGPSPEGLFWDIFIGLPSSTYQ